MKKPASNAAVPSKMVLREACQKCDGSGLLPADWELMGVKLCPECNGWGHTLYLPESGERVVRKPKVA